MAAVVGVVTTIVGVITSVVSAVVTTIGGIISTIAYVISTIVSTVGSVILPIISAVGTYIFQVLRNAFVAVKSLAISVYSTLVASITSFISTVLPAFESIYHTITTITGTIHSLFKSIIGSITPYLTSLTNTIRSFTDAIVKPIKLVLGKIREVYSAIKASIIGKILQPIKEVVEFLSTLHTIAQAYQAFKEDKYLKGIYILAMRFDQQLATEIKETKMYVETNIMSVIKDIDSIFRSVRTDITTTYQYTLYLETVINNIGNFLGVESIENIAEGLEKFRLNILDLLRKDITDAQKLTISYMENLVSPVYRLFREITMADTEYKRLERIYNFLALKHLQPVITGYTPAQKLMVLKRKRME